jgi:hypothetical protein
VSIYDYIIVIKMKEFFNRKIKKNRNWNDGMVEWWNDEPAYGTKFFKRIKTGEYKIRPYDPFGDGGFRNRNSNFNTPRLLHLYEGGGPPLERGLPQKADH